MRSLTGAPNATVSFDALVSAIRSPQIALISSSRLKVAGKPAIFVAPPLLSKAAGLALPVDVIFIQAAAAVGKSTFAKALSAASSAPILDLSSTAVSTQSLAGLVHSDFDSTANALSEFQVGRLPIIVDALDEGRLKSGEQNFEQFLITTGELLGRSSTAGDGVKLIMLGRPDSIELASIGLQLGSENFSSILLTVDFFDEESARLVIDQSAKAAARPGSAYFIHKLACRELVDAYFSGIENALDLKDGSLWQTESGREFAGYAPVLSALGTMLAEFENFVDVKNKLEERGAQDAWEVIEAVMTAILAREQRQVQEQLASKIRSPVPAETYDAEEQLTLLSALIHNARLPPTTRVPLAPEDLRTYETMVKQRLPEHPFVRQGKPANAVLGSIVLAHAVRRNLIKLGDNTWLGPMSRQPFLWRCLRKDLRRERYVLDGRYVGYLLHSLWSDVASGVGRVVISDMQSKAPRLQISLPGNANADVELASPVWLYAEASNCEVRLTSSLRLCGEVLAGQGGSFVVRGPAQLVCSDLDVDTDELVLEGDCWLESQTIQAHDRISIQPINKYAIGLGGVLKVTYPWDRLTTTLDAPIAAPPKTVLEALLKRCGERLPSVLILKRDFAIPENDHLEWLDREFPGQFPELVRLLVLFGLARAEPVDARGPGKLQVRFLVAFSELSAVASRPLAPGSKYSSFLQAAAKQIG